MTAFLGEAGNSKLPVDLSAPARRYSGFFHVTQFVRRS